MHKGRWIFLLYSLFVLAGCATPHLNLIPAGNRPPNLHETFYTAVAADFGDANLCPKIYRLAVDESCGPDFACTHWRVAYERSKCFFYAALKSRNSVDCNSVKSITVLPSNKSEISKSECLKVIRDRQQFQYQPIPNPIALSKILPELGYQQRELDSIQYRDPMNSPVHDFYDTVRHNKDFRSKVEDFPDYSEPMSEEKVRPANQYEYLMEMVAFDDRLYNLCGKISPNAYYRFPGTTGLRGRLSLRDECFYYVAEKAVSSRFCEEMAPDAALTITGKGHRKTCEKWIAIEKLRHLEPRPDEDGPVFFPATPDFAEALVSMGL
jgi:hypothetical protein